MATLLRPQLVLDSLAGIKTGQSMTHETIQVTKTGTMTFGTLLKADFTEAVAGDLATGIVYVIDDLALLDSEIATGDELTITAVAGSGQDWVIFRASELKLGSTPLSAGELVTYAKKTQ